MRKNCKDNLIADAHRNPEYASMPAKRLATIIDADQTTISKWRRRMRDALGVSKPRKTWSEQVTVDSVRRKWEEKYAHLNRQYEALADRLVEMAKNADKHRNNEKSMEGRLNHLRAQLEVTSDLLEEKIQLIEKMESRSWIQRLFSSKA